MWFWWIIREEGRRKGGEEEGEGVSVPVNVEHAERLDAVVAQDLLLGRVDVAQADVDELPDVDEVVGLQPAEVLGLLLAGEARQEADGHAVDVARVAGLGGVDVGVGVDPDEGDLAAEALAHRLGRAGHGADRDRVVAAQRQHHAALPRVRVYLLAQPLRHAADRPRVLHVPVRRVLLRHDVRVRVHLLVPVQLVVQLLAQLRQQARFDQRRRPGVYSRLALHRRITPFHVSPFCHDDQLEES